MFVALRSPHDFLGIVIAADVIFRGGVLVGVGLAVLHLAAHSKTTVGTLTTLQLAGISDDSSAHLGS